MASAFPTTTTYAVPAVGELAHLHTGSTKNGTYARISGTLTALGARELGPSHFVITATVTTVAGVQYTEALSRLI